MSNAILTSKEKGRAAALFLFNVLYKGMKNGKYEFSSVHVNIPSPLAEEIVAWSHKTISEDDIFINEREPNFGREDEMHVTILYGIHAEDPDNVQALLEDIGPIKVRFGKLEVFTNPEAFDVVHIHVLSPDLRRLNKKLEEKVPFTNKYSYYRPHATLAYVKKGKGWKHRGNSYWEGEQFTCDSVVFSSKNGQKTELCLKSTGPTKQT